MGKMVVLKPVVWNDNGYTWPAGIPATSGYSSEHGYGHEEWNGRSDWVWSGWKLFHTEAKGQMHDYAVEGRLGIIMTTMLNGKFLRGWRRLQRLREQRRRQCRNRLGASSHGLW